MIKVNVSAPLKKASTAVQSLVKGTLTGTRKVLNQLSQGSPAQRTFKSMGGVSFVMPLDIGGGPVGAGSIRPGATTVASATTRSFGSRFRSLFPTLSRTGTAGKTAVGEVSSGFSRMVANPFAGMTAPQATKRFFGKAAYLTGAAYAIPKFYEELSGVKQSSPNLKSTVAGSLAGSFLSNPLFLGTAAAGLLTRAGVNVLGGAKDKLGGAGSAIVNNIPSMPSLPSLPSGEELKDLFSGFNKPQPMGDLTFAPQVSAPSPVFAPSVSAGGGGMSEALLLSLLAGGALGAAGGFMLGRRKKKKKKYKKRRKHGK